MDHVHSDLSDSPDLTPRQHVEKLSFEIPKNQNVDDQRPANVVTRDEPNSFVSLSDRSDSNCGARLTQHPNILTTFCSCKRDLFTAGVSAEPASLNVAEGIPDSDSRSAFLGEAESHISDPGFVEDETRVSISAQKTCEEVSSAMDTVSSLDEQACSLCYFTHLVSRVSGSTVNNNERIGPMVGQSPGFEELSDAACDVPSTLKSSCSIVKPSDNLFSCVQDKSDSVDDQSRRVRSESTCLSEHHSADQCKTNSVGEQFSSALSSNIGLDNPFSSIRGTPNIVDGMVNSVSGTDTCPEDQLRSSQDSTNITHELTSPAHNENGRGNEQCRSLSGTNNNLNDELCVAQEKLGINNEELNTALSAATTSGHSSTAHNKDHSVDEQVQSISSSEDCNHDQKTTICVDEESSSVKHNNKSSKKQVNLVSGTDHCNDDHFNLSHAMCNRISEHNSVVKDDTGNFNEHFSSNQDNAKNVDEEPSTYQEKTSSVDGQLNSISSTANSHYDQFSSVQGTSCIIQDQLISASSTASGADDSCQLDAEAALSGRAASEISGQELPLCRHRKQAADPAHTEETASGPDGQVVAPLPALSKKKKKKLRQLEKQKANTEKERASKRAECITGPSVTATSQKGCCKSAEDAGAISLVDDINQDTCCCGPSHKTNAPAGQNVQPCGKRKAKKNKQSKLPLEIRVLANLQSPADNIASAKAQKLTINCPVDITTTEGNIRSESPAVLHRKVQAKGRKSGPHPEGTRVPACSSAANPIQKRHLPQTVAAGSVPQRNSHVCPARSAGGQGLPALGKKRPLLSGYPTIVRPDLAPHFSPDQSRNERNLIQIRTFPGHFNKKKRLLDTDFYYGRQSDSNNGTTASETPLTQESNTLGADSAMKDTCTQQQSDSSDLPGTSQRHLVTECPATFNNDRDPVDSVADVGGQTIRHFQPNHFSVPWKQNRFRYSEPIPRYRRDFNTPAPTGFRPFNNFRRHTGQFNVGQDVFSQFGGPRHVLLNSQDSRQEPASNGADRAHSAVGRTAPGDTGDIGYRGPRYGQPPPQWKRQWQTSESGAEEHNSMPAWKRRKQTTAPLYWNSPESYQRECQNNTGPAWLRTTSVPLSGPHHIIFESPASPESSSSLLGSSYGDLRRSLTPVSQPSEGESSDIPVSRAGQRIPANYANPEVKCLVCLRSGLTLWSRCAHVQVCTSCVSDDLNEPLTNCSVCQILAHKS